MKKFILFMLILFFVAQVFSKDVLVSTEKDRKQLFITVYNSDRALVYDKRLVNVPKGEFVLKFMDVSKDIIPESVNFENADLTLYEQNFEYDLLTPSKLLEKFVGRNIEVIEKKLQDNSTKEVIKKAKILSVNNGVVYEIDGKIITGKSFSGYIFPEIPKNLISHPTLLWVLKSFKSGKEEIGCSYLTSGMSWSSNYVLFLNETEEKGSLNGWITLKNESGTSFKNGILKLVAGELNLVRNYENDRILYKTVPKVSRANPTYSGATEKKFFEYHIYTVKRKVTIKNNQKKQISMFSIPELNLKKIYVINGYSDAYSSNMSKIDVKVFLKFKNSKANHLGIPLPAGVFRVYKRDTDGSPIFVGEDKIKHTPKDEDVKIKMGKAFDIVAEKKCINREKLAKNLYEAEFKYMVKNHKDKKIVVEIYEYLPSLYTKIIYSSQKYEKISANRVKFLLPVEKNGKSELTYKIRVKY